MSITSADRPSILRIVEHQQKCMQTLKIKRYGYLAGGVASFIMLCGVGIVSTLFGYAALADKSSAADQIATAISNSLASATIKSTATGTAMLDTGSTVRLADGSTVALSPDQAVKIDPNSRIEVTIKETPQIGPTSAQLQLSEQDTLSRVSTTYVLFHSEKMANGRVESAWEYNVGQPEPRRQNCSYVVELDQIRSLKFLVAADKIPAPSIKDASGVDNAAALQKCSWAS
jgi:hypothetical protein